MFPKLRKLQTHLEEGPEEKMLRQWDPKPEIRAISGGNCPLMGHFFLSRRPKRKKKNLAGNINKAKEETTLWEESQL